jgi:1,4-dihydroxy-2-naphthoate octaprenyltransferase
MNQLKSYLYTSRLRTLPLSISCVINAGAIAYYLDAFSFLIFLFSLLTILLLQVISNFSNDIGDFEHGTDDETRIGPKRAIQSGMLSPSNIKLAIKILISACIISGIVLLTISHIFIWQKILFFSLGLISIWAANNYTRGNISYGYKMLGDLSVFIFFGILGVTGCLFLFIHTINNASLFVAIGLGLLTVAVLHLNNLRDLYADKEHNKITLAVKLGHENSKIYFLLLVLFGIVFWGSYVFTQNLTNLFSYLYYLGFLPMLFILVTFFKVKKNEDYDKILKPLAISIVATSVLFFLSQIF